MRRKKRTSTSMISKILMNESQRAKFDMVQESVDLKGIVNKNKKTNQTVYDLMLINDYINQQQHEAVFLFVGDLASSGASVASANLEGLSHAPAYTVGGNISDRRMSFSSAYRFVLNDCGQRDTEFMMSVTNNLYLFPESKPEQAAYAKKLSRLISKPLTSLSKFYGIDQKKDPRDILRLQAGAKRSYGFDKNHDKMR